MSSAIESEPYPNPRQLGKVTYQEAVRNFTNVVLVEVSYPKDSLGSYRVELDTEGVYRVISEAVISSSDVGGSFPRQATFPQYVTMAMYCLSSY
jgi:hypothetical protein